MDSTINEKALTDMTKKLVYRLHREVSLLGIEPNKETACMVTIATKVFAAILAATKLTLKEDRGAFDRLLNLVSRVAEEIVDVEIKRKRGH